MCDVSERMSVISYGCMTRRVRTNRSQIAAAHDPFLASAVLAATFLLQPKRIQNYGPIYINDTIYNITSSARVVFQIPLSSHVCCRHVTAACMCNWRRHPAVGSQYYASALLANRHARRTLTATARWATARMHIYIVQAATARSQGDRYK